jgi:uncharacterized protein
MRDELARKHDALAACLRRLGSLAVAFSGGVDSTLLLRVAHDVLGDRALAVTASSETYPAAEGERAKELARDMGVRQAVIETSEIGIPGFADNPPDRCYHCKLELFTRVKRIAAEHGIEYVADGTNADDADDYRPGARAADELGVVAPLADAGLTKADIRELSRELDLPTWNIPARACLASRFPYGTRITADKLGQVEKAEEALRELGFEQCRVRHHGDVARIEVRPEDVQRLAAPPTAAAVTAALRRAGFRYVAVDLEGYRTGSLNEVLPGTERSNGS